MDDIAIYEKLNKFVVATNQNKLKAKDVSNLKRLLADNPQLWRSINLAHSTALNLINEECINEGGQAMAEANYYGIRRDFGYDQANSLERILIDHVALCWLRLQYAEHRYTSVLHQESIPIHTADYWERRLSSNQKRYLKALETFARIKRLRLPAMQVNIADKQVNIAGD